MNAIKGKEDEILEATLALARKEENPKVVGGIGNITSLFGFISHQRPEMVDPEFGLTRGYTQPEGITTPPPIQIPIENLVT